MEHFKSRALADKILSQLRQADIDGKYLFIIVTGDTCSGKTTVMRMVVNEYKRYFKFNPKLRASEVFDNNVFGVPVKMWLDTSLMFFGVGRITHPWVDDDIKGTAIAIIEYDEYTEPECIKNIPSLITMVKNNFVDYKYRYMNHIPEPVTPCHILCVINKEHMDLYHKLRIRDQPTCIYSLE